MRKNKASTAKIAIWYVISNLLVKGVAMLTTPIFTRLMSKSEFGQFNNLTSWESIMIIIVTLDFTASIMRAKYDFADDMKKYMSSILLFGNVVTICVYVVIELNRNFFVDLLSMDMRYIRILFVYLLFMPAFSYLQVEHRIYGKYKFFVAYSIVSTFLRTIISIILVYLLEDKFYGRVLGYLMPMVLLTMVLWGYVVVRGRGISWEHVKYACKISIPLIPHALSGTVLAGADKIMITKYCGDEETALYALAYTVATIATLLWSSMNQAWSPWLFDKLNEKKHIEINKYSKAYLGIYAILIIGVLLIAPEIVLVLGGKEYYVARYVMPPVILGCVFQFVNGMYINIEIYEKKTFAISVGTVSAALLNVVLNQIFIPRYGYIAAAYTTLVGYMAQAAFHFFNVMRISKQYKSVYDIKFVFGIIAVLIGMGWSLSKCYDGIVVRMILLVLYIGSMLLVVCKQWKSISSMIKK